MARDNRRARTLAEAIRDAQEARGLSQREVAEALDVRQQTISRWSRGENLPKANETDRIRAVAHFLRLPIADVRQLIAASRRQADADIDRRLGELERIVASLATTVSEVVKRIEGGGPGNGRAGAGKRARVRPA